jgi:two-component system CheB/CheR fusion protein
VQLEAVLKSQLAPHRDLEADRISLEGPAVSLRPVAALSLGLIFHELATNAVKYGALSREKGRVTVSWKLEGKEPSRLVIRWLERGGPPVKKPSRRGFGTELIEREAQFMLHGEAAVEFGKNGLEATIRVPLDPEVASVRAEKGG